MSFAMVLARRPISSTSGGKEKFKAAIQAAARGRIHSGRAPMFERDALYARIVWFHGYKTSQDIDNIAKRILDSLIGVVYLDDEMIVKCCLEKVHYTAEPYELADSTVSDVLHAKLVSLLGQRCEDVLYVEMGTIAARRVVFGPIDEVSDESARIS